MMSWTIYHNPRCQKSRQTLDLLQKNNIKPEIREYLKNPPTKQELKAILEKLDLQPSNLIRGKEPKIKELKIDLENQDKVFQAMIQYPELIERPIVIKGKKAVLGRPPENVKKLL